MRLSSLTQRGLLGSLLVITLAACGSTQSTASNPTTSVPTTSAPAATAAPLPTLTSGQGAPSGSQPTAVRGDTEATGPKRITFASGATSGAVEGAVVRGDRDSYVLWAAAGQTMTMRISALESNAVFSLARPDGQVIPGTEEGQDVTTWSGTLPQSGDYAIAVGPTRGNATYRLEVTVVTPEPTNLDQSIRKTDWNAAFAADPQLRVEVLEGKSYVTVSAGNPAVGGIPLTDKIVYGDFDNNGIEEAAIPLASGGTAGNIGFLVYRQAAPAPKLIAWRDGYHQGLDLVDGRLVSRDALYGGWEPNCCPSGFRYLTYTLDSDGLKVALERTEPLPGTHVTAVEHFYSLLSQHDLANAYAMLSDGFKQANPYDGWAAGYANTANINAEVTPDGSHPNSAHVTLTSTDSTADGGQTTQHFAGTWSLYWDPGRPGWVLDAAQIAQQP